MAGFTKYMQELALNWVKGSTFAAAPAAVYLGLFTTAPADDNSAGTEVSTSGSAYARKAITLGAVSGTNTSSMSNSAKVDFGVSTSAWGDLVAFGVYDAVTDGNLLMWNGISTVTVGVGNDVEFAIDALTLTVA